MTGLAPLKSPTMSTIPSVAAGTTLYCKFQKLPSNVHFCTPPLPFVRLSATYTVLASANTNPRGVGNGDAPAVGNPGRTVVVWRVVVGRPVPTDARPSSPATEPPTYSWLLNTWTPSRLESV